VRGASPIELVTGALLLLCPMHQNQLVAPIGEDLARKIGYRYDGRDRSIE
jgi:hypothetical protein